MELAYIELRHNGELLQVEGTDAEGYTNVTLVYNTKGDLKLGDFEESSAWWLTSCALKQIHAKKPFSLEGDANNMPSIGSYIVTRKTVEVT